MKREQSQHSLAQRFISIVQQSFRTLLRKYKLALAVIFLAVIFGGLTFAGILESIFYLPGAAKISLVVLLLVGSIGVVIYYYKQLNSLTFKEFYHQFSKKTGEPKLSDALDLHFDPNTEKLPLYDAAINQNLKKLQPLEVQSRLNHFSQDHKIHKHYRAGLSGALGTLVLLIGFTLFQPNAMDRLAHFWVGYEPPNPYSYTIDPGSVTLEQGESFTPTINFDDEYPERLSLAFKTDIEENFRQRNPVSVKNQQANFSSINPTTNGTYYFEMDRFRSEEFRVRVQLRPRLEQLTLEVRPPSYTGLSATSYTYPFSRVQAYRGSKISLMGITNKPVQQLSLSRTIPADTAQTITLDSDSTSNRYNHQWISGATDTVSFTMSDSAGLSNKNKFRFVIEPREDQPPFVNLIAPSENLQMKNPEKLSLQYEAGDDFGLTGASLHFELQRAFVDNPEKGSISLPDPQMNEPQAYTWDMPALNPKPRDVITYWIEVRDNDAYSGNKAGRSQKMTIRFPSMTEYMDELDTKEQEVSESLDNLSESFDQMQQQYDQFKNQLKRNPETNWEQKQQLEEVEKERKKIDEQVDELNKKFEDIRKEIEKNQAMSPETMETYDELQKLMKEINDPELQKALEELRNSLGEMNPDQMRKALENYEFNEEQYKQRINRTLELFKSLKLNSDLEKMAQSLEELAKQEEQISESEQNAAEDLEQQQAVQEDLNDVEKQLEDLDKNAPKKAQKQVKRLKKETSDQMEELKKQLQENMEQLKQQESSQPSSQTKEQQRNMQKQMQQMADNMRKAKQKMNQQSMQVNMGALEYILYSLINLSTNQEELTKETESLPPRSQSFVDKARKERNISSQFSMLSDSLYNVSSEIPSFSNQINKKKAEVEGELSRAVTMLAERDKSNSTFAQRQSLGGINELSTMIASLLDQLQNSQQQGGSGGSMSMQQFMEQMKKMSGQQQQLNEQIQNMINDIQGNRLNREQMDRLNQMSKQQNQIRKQLKELQRRGGLESGDRVLSELERMSEQMEDAINNIRGGQLDQQLMQSQKNILSRMLSAEKAVQERGKEDRREATTAQEAKQAVPPDVTLEELQQRIRKMLNDPDRTKFTDDYQRLIEQYFELLKKQDKEVLQ